MTWYLPTGGFQWLTQDVIKKLDVNTIRKDSPDSCIVEVELEYQEKFHNFHDDYHKALNKIEEKYLCIWKYAEKLKINTIFQFVESKIFYWVWTIMTNIFFIIETWNYIYSKEWSRKKLSSVDVWAILIAKIIYRL